MKRTDIAEEFLAEKVKNTKQYPFEPDAFCKVFYEVFGDGFIWYDLFFNREEYEAFVLWHKDDTWYIYSKQFDITICWYKGLGRMNQCTNEYLTEEGLRSFFIALRQDYEEEI